ncbi:ATP-dependent helicase [Sanguibacter suaedae]|uniref:DNA 3'-5' helicase n=1 Tax=Sanguibacter suaedae TaxID=2795737 RepID=A0A934IC65_9MICO|nr:ATP-dependent DNA helicase [Sanguibacter suaedae]MBI9114189.1 ATP-dependent helicase [Sanguibacter suaedae]
MELRPPRDDTTEPSGSSAVRVVLDDSQRRALEVASHAPTSLILGAPGTGKTVLAIELVVAAVRGGVSPDEVLVLSATRRGAGELRDRIAARLGLTVRGAMVRTAASAAFSVLARSAQAHGEPPPTLITGPEQDLALAELLEGHARGEGTSVRWPAHVPEETLALRGFREELRDLLMRAAERGLAPDELADLGDRHGRPEWVAAAAVYDEYLSVMSLRQLTPDAGARYDPAVVVDEAARVLAEADPEDRPGWRVVVVDDYQEATAATARLCHVLASHGARLVLLADPDSSVQAFRGASPSLVGRAAAGAPPREGDLGPGDVVGELGATTAVLERAWRHGPRVRAATRTVSQEVGTVGAVEHRRARPASEVEDVVETTVLPGRPLEEAYVARVLRAEHLLRGTPWSRMAVVARSGGELVRLRRALASASVPVAIVGADVALRDEPAVRPLLRALRAVSTDDPPDVDLVVDLLTSPLGGIDAVALRRLRRALRTEELAAGGTRTSDDLLVEVVEDTARSATLPHDVARAPGRVARVLAAGRDAVAAPGATAQTVLWALWAAADLAETWRSIAVHGGPGSARADHDLDSVMALFRSAEQFVDRVPQATALAFADLVESQDIPADNLAVGGAGEETVPLLTPAGAAGGEWEVVVVAGVQDGSWPDLRLRDSLLGAQSLVDLLDGRSDGSPMGREARRAVLADELRAFVVAVSRATRRLVVTASRDLEDEPSVLLDLLGLPDVGGPEDATDLPAGDAGPGGEPLGAAPLDLRGLVAVVRGELVDELSSVDGSERAERLAGLLVDLARHGVAEADPRTWYGAAELSTDAPLWAPGASVPVSPSKVEQVHRCALRWALESAGGTTPAALAQSVGTLVHDIARTMPRGRHSELAAELDRRWPELGMPDGWPATQARRRADDMVRRLADYVAEVEGDVVVEEEFELEVGRAVLRGAVDRIEQVDDGVRITDLKTGKGIPTAADAETNAQLGAYQLAVESGAFPSLPEGTRSVGAQLVFLAEGARGATRRTQPALGDPGSSWARSLVEEAAETMAAARFAAVENSLCGVCTVRRACPLQPEGRHVVGPAPAPDGDGDGAGAGAHAPSTSGTPMDAPQPQERTP